MLRVCAWLVLLPMSLALPLAGCGETSVAKPEVGAARVEPIGETRLSRITLTSRAAERIGIETAEVGEGVAARTLIAAAEVMAAKGDPSALEVRVALNASDFARVDQDKPARILPDADSDAGALAGQIARVEQTAGYGDGAVYYAPDRRDNGLAIGQRPRVEMALRASGGARQSVPYQAVLYDDEGATWVYTSSEALVFVRARVKVDYVEGDLAILAESPPAGTRVVTVGLTELYGAEFGVDE